ncbi:MAG: phosphatidylserine decarboxylase family protein, partial [Geminicoccaceae bacterium]
MAEPGSLGSIIAPIHKAGWPFIAIFFAVAVVLGFLWQPLFWLGLVATLWCVFFFRDPPRTTPIAPGLVTSPCDGMVAATTPRVPPP